VICTFGPSPAANLELVSRSGPLGLPGSSQGPRRLRFEGRHARQVGEDAHADAGALGVPTPRIPLDSWRPPEGGIGGPG